MKISNLWLKLCFLILFISIFAIGWFSNSTYSYLNEFNIQKPLNIFQGTPKDHISPYDHIKKDQIHVFEDRIILDIKDAEWAGFTDTNSMDPIVDTGANSFEIKPKSTENIHIGDIISYNSDYASGTIIHRVVEISKDSEGWYCKVKGDNLSKPDKGKIRFNQIQGIIIGVIY